MDMGWLMLILAAILLFLGILTLIRGQRFESDDDADYLLIYKPLSEGKNVGEL